MHHAVGNILAVAAAASQALDRIQEIAKVHQQISEPHRRPVAVSSFGELVAKEA